MSIKGATRAMPADRPPFETLGASSPGFRFENSSRRSRSESLR